MEAPLLIVPSSQVGGCTWYESIMRWMRNEHNAFGGTTLFVWGQTGVGKSEGIRRAAAQCGLVLTVLEDELSWMNAKQRGQSQSRLRSIDPRRMVCCIDGDIDESIGGEFTGASVFVESVIGLRLIVVGTLPVVSERTARLRDLASEQVHHIEVPRPSVEALATYIASNRTTLGIAASPQQIADAIVDAKCDIRRTLVHIRFNCAPIPSNTVAFKPTTALICNTDETIDSRDGMIASAPGLAHAISYELFQSYCSSSDDPFPAIIDSLALGDVAERHSTLLYRTAAVVAPATILATMPRYSSSGTKNGRRRPLSSMAALPPLGSALVGILPPPPLGDGDEGRQLVHCTPSVLTFRPKRAVVASWRYWEGYSPRMLGTSNEALLAQYNALVDESTGRSVGFAASAKSKRKRAVRAPRVATTREKKTKRTSAAPVYFTAAAAAELAPSMMQFNDL